jgi:alkyl sulfatase BDS1-like metallo-beta-lactamase superfamily hydrolase
MIQVDGGYVAIDAGTTPHITRRIAAEWQRLAGGSVQALIYTHSHPDHIGGASGFELESVPIWGHRNFLDEHRDTQFFPNAFYARGAKQSGAVLPEEVALSNGIGPPLRLNESVLPPLYFPNHLVGDTQELNIGGRVLVLRWSPGETMDHLSVWLPEHRVLFVGDNLYRAFPNLYTLRGTSPRPVLGWIDTLDALRRLQPRPELLILGHTAPIQGADAIYQLLTDYRDAIAFVHDSVLRGINAGKSPNQLAREIRLPVHLANHPFLREHYGTVAGSVRGIYTGYIGWFDGDAANVDPPADEEIGSWLAEEFGGTQELLLRIQRATERGDLRRAVWLSKLLCACSPGSASIRRAKAQALEKSAEVCENPLVRNWLLSEAALLQGRCHLPAKPKLTAATIARIPVERLLRLLPSRLNPKTSAKVTLAIGFDVVDRGQQYTFFIRRGVGELAPGLIASPQLLIRAKECDLIRIFMAGDVTPMQREFWEKLEFIVADQGFLTPLHRLFRLARLGRLFLRP